MSRGTPFLLNDAQRLSIALQMRHDFSSALHKYKFSPKHKVFHEMCMIVQTKYFEVCKNIESPREIPREMFDSKNEGHVVVREIAFGPLMSTEDRHLALWFDIDEQEVEECSEKEICRYQRTKARLQKQKRRKQEDAMKKSSLPSMTFADMKETPNNSYRAAVLHGQNNNGITRRAVPTSFDDDNSSTINKPFLLCTPKDEDSYHLVTDVLQNCLDSLTSSSGTYSFEKITKKRLELSQRFYALMKHYSMFHFPINDGREHVDETTPNPDPRGEYRFPSTRSNRNGASWHESLNRRVWESFLKTVSHIRLRLQ